MGIQVAVAGASGYAGGELLRLLAGHPDLEIAAVTAGSSAGKPITSIHPNLTGHPAFDGKNFETTTAETLGGAELIFMALPHGESAALAAQLPGARIVDLSADFRLGDEAAWHQFYGDVSHAGRWAYGLPELPRRRGSRAPGEIKAARTVAAPGCYATTSILALAPLLAAGLVEPDDIVIVAASGTSGAGRSLRTTCSPARSWAACRPTRSAAPTGTPRRSSRPCPRSCPSLARDASSPRRWPRCPAASSPPATARLTPGRDQRGRDERAARRVRRRLRRRARSCTCCPRASGRSPPRSTAPTAAHSGRGRPARGPRGRDLAIDNLGKGAAGQAVQIANLMLGLPGDGRPDHPRSRPVSVTAPARLPRRGRDRRAQGVRRPRRRARRQRRPVPRRRRRLHRPTGSRPPRSCGPARWSSGGRVAAVVLNSGGANACTGPHGFQDTHATAERLAAALDDSAGRDRGLLHRPDRRAAADGQAAARPWTRPSPRPTGAAACTPPTRSAPPTPSPRSPSGGEDGYAIGGMAKGAGMLAPALATMLVRAHHRRRPHAPPELDAALRSATAAPSTGSTPTAACPPTTPCC